MKNQSNSELKSEFSEENKNLEVVPGRENFLTKEEKVGQLVIDKDALDAKKSRNIIVGKLNVFISPLRKRHEKYYKESKFHLAVDLILTSATLIMVAAVIYFAFWHPGKNIALDLNFENEKIASGGIETLVISYGNKNGGELKNGNIAVNLPRNFSIESVEPGNIFNGATNTFKIGDLPAGGNGKIKIKGFVIGELGDAETTSVIFSYEISGKKMSVLNSLTYIIEESVLSLNLDMPDEIYKESVFNGEIKIRNGGEKDLENVELAADGANWDIKQSSRASNNNILSLGRIKAGEEIAVQFEALAKADEGKHAFILSAYLVNKQRKIKQAVFSKEVAVEAPRFKVSLLADRKSMQADEEVNFRLDYKNDEKEGISDLKITLLEEDNNFSLAKLAFNNVGNLKQEGRDALSGVLLEKGGEGKVGLRAKFARKKIEAEEEIYLSAAVSYEIGGKKVNYTARSPKIRIISNLNVYSAGYYYSPQGDQLGVGPLPPTVDIPTAYWIFWEADNLGNDLKDLSITADLPENVIWTNNKSLLAGNLRYGQIGRRVIWTVDEISKNGGNYKVGFEIQIIPTKDDIGKILNILTGVKYSAFDKFCEKEIEGNLKIITTNLEFDRLAGGKGVVIE